MAGLIVLHTPNTDRRRGHACNVALDYLKEHSEAYDLLCFLDDDDHLLPPFAERLAAALGLTGADLAYCGSNAVPAQGESHAMHGILPAAALFGGNFIPINAYAVRTEAVLAANARFDETIDYLEDWDFLVQLMAAGVRAIPVFETLSEFRLIGDGNSMQRRDPVHFDHCLTRVRGNAAAAAARLPVALFWRDVFDFPTERRLALKTTEIAHLQAAKRLFAGASTP
jgi:glycosyltransferase involved in cell wall biosynthesis